MKQKKKSIRTILILLTVLTIIVSSALSVSAAGSYRVQKNTYTTVCYTSGTPYIKIENTLRSKLDVRMKDKNGKVVWQENNAIRSGESYRTFYCGKNVNRIEIRVNSGNVGYYGNIVWKVGSKSQLK